MRAPGERRVRREARRPRGEPTFRVRQVHVMHEDFSESGPGSGGIDMDEGLELINKFSTALGAQLKRREQLGLAQKLFNLPIQAYPELTEVEASIKDLRVIYDLFKEQRETREGWAATLWSDLDMSVMEKGSEDFDLRLKKMSKHIKGLKPFRKLEEIINAFINSLPLIQSLKNGPPLPPYPARYPTPPRALAPLPTHASVATWQTRCASATGRS